MKGRRILPREQRKSAPLRGVDRLMQPVPAHNKIYCLQYSWLDLSSQARRGKHGVARSFGTKIFILRVLRGFYSSFCGLEDLNFHASRHQHLKLACLPVPPRPQLPLKVAILGIYVNHATDGRLIQALTYIHRRHTL
jgi:hypothetical protein